MNRKHLWIALAVILLGAAIWMFSLQTVLKPAKSVGLPLAAVTVPRLNDAQKVGEAKFNQYCAACHGANAAGQDGVAPPLVHQLYVPSHHSDQAFFSAATSGARAHHWPFGDMLPVEGITSEDIQQIVTYVRALQVANGIQ